MEAEMCQLQAGELSQKAVALEHSRKDFAAKCTLLKVKEVPEIG